MPYFEPRRGEPGERLEWRDGNAEVHRLTFDDEGIAHPKTQGQAQAADAFGKPVARKAIEDEKTKKAKKPKRHAAPAPVLVEPETEPPVVIIEPAAPAEGG